MKRSAFISVCGRYRWSLTRVWDETEKMKQICWIMLNPSTADDVDDDPTINKCFHFSLKWGYGGMVVVNCFSLRATQPAVMMRSWSKLTDDEKLEAALRNLDQVEKAIRRRTIVAAWGNHGAFENAGDSMLRFLFHGKNKVHCLGLTKAIEPKHPLFVHGDTKLVQLQPGRRSP